MKKGALPVPLSRLIDFAYSMNCCHIIGDAVTDYALGRFLAENEFVPEAEGLSDAAFERLDFATIGRSTGRQRVAYTPASVMWSSTIRRWKSIKL